MDPREPIFRIILHFRFRILRRDAILDNLEVIKRTIEHSERASKVSAFVVKWRPAEFAEFSLKGVPGVLGSVTEGGDERLSFRNVDGLYEVHREGQQRNSPFYAGGVYPPRRGKRR